MAIWLDEFPWHPFPRRRCPLGVSVRQDGDAHEESRLLDGAVRGIPSCGKLGVEQGGFLKR